jgi:hypothetical protein
VTREEPLCRIPGFSCSNSPPSCRRGASIALSFVHRARRVACVAQGTRNRRGAQSGVSPCEGAKKGHLADVDAVVTEDGVCRRQMEIDIRYRDLQQVMVAIDDLAA